jgi:hypothetical protein
MSATAIEILGAALFAIALVHTFSTKFFEHLALRQPRHAGIWHLLGEVEVVFGFWAMILLVAMFALQGEHDAINYIETRNFTEPMFVFSIMVIAGTRPVLQFAMSSVRVVARMIPVAPNAAYYVVVLALVPLLGSFITEPAAMTLAALVLRDRYFAQNMSTRFKYATLGVLFVNISIGGTLTPFAAPPVLMVARQWNWDFTFMLTMFGWKAALAVLVNALGVTVLFRKELAGLHREEYALLASVPKVLTAFHLLCMLGLVMFAHHPALFMGIFLIFLGVAHAYESHQQPLILREALLVAFFLAGLVTLGGMQQWWLQPVLMSMNSEQVYFGATALTAVTDNAAITYLGSLVEGLSDEFKFALVAGAVTGGGLTIIANAPNPAGIAILRSHFADEAVHPLGLLLAALPPTIVAGLALLLL